MTDRREHGRRPLVRGASFLAALALLLAACSPGGGRAEPTSNVEPLSGTEATTTVAPEPAPDPSALLATGLAAHRDGYRFTSQAYVDGDLAGEVGGIVVGDRAQVVVGSGDAEVTYVITPEARWVRSSAGSWERLSGEAPVADPLAELADPRSVTVVSTNGDRVELEAVYVDAFGVEGELTVRLVIAGGRLVEAGYRVEGPPEVRVTTTFAPLEAGTEVTLPETVG